jgi:hypothetical protein
MTSVEEIIDQIRQTFSPLDVIDINKTAPLQAKLRLLSYQITKDVSQESTADITERALEWYDVEGPKFDRKPCTVFRSFQFM